MQITSLNNEKVKYWKSLNEKKVRDAENKFLIEGDHLVNEALKNNCLKEVISLKEENLNIPCYEVTKEVMNKITNQKSNPSIIGICEKIKEQPLSGNVLILDGIQDPGNLGTIIRSAVAFNIKNILLVNNCVDLYNEKVIRSCEGMIFNLNIIRDDEDKNLEFIKENYQIYGTDVIKGITCNQISKDNNLAIIIGSEGQGMSDKYRSICNNFINLEMTEECESLNAAIAASIIMYEIYKK